MNKRDYSNESLEELWDFVDSFFQHAPSIPYISAPTVSGYSSPEGYHRHKCNFCGNVWEHSNDMAGNDDAHKCTKCGTENWFHYKGHCAPTGRP